MIFRNMNQRVERSPVSWLFGLMGLILFFVLMYWLIKGLFAILSWAAPVLLILTAIINYRVILDYGRMLLDTFKRNWLIGILGVLLTVVGFPFVAGFLFVKALLLRKVGQLQSQYEQQRQGEYVQYEDLSDSEPLDDAVFIDEPPPLRHQRYDDIFDEK